MEMEGALRKLSTLYRGTVTVYQRRGLKYFAYVWTGCLWPKLLYRFGWGPDASSLARGVFEAFEPMTTTRPPASVLRAMGLLIDRGEAGARQVPVTAAEALMDRAHAGGITGVRHGFDSMRGVNDTDAGFTSMPDVRQHRRRCSHFRAARDADRRAFNERFGTSLLTEADARQQLVALKERVPGGYREYAPIDFGGGLHIGPIGSTDSGTGRWDFFNGAVVGPLVAGKRVLDLGCNNGSLPLMMLRAGAREIVAIEMAPAIAEFARLNAQILSWRDLQHYPFDVRNGDMRMFLTDDLGRFDVVTAFCSLYYLPEMDMSRIVRKAATMGATLVLQANEAIDNLPARAHQLYDLMKHNGYADVDVIAPPGFARPLLIGQLA
jgi:2-polyprenyl-3-methyl-5-hydroxy-6-metoxy-1,4-benzoquinol methylase